jgi:hypothetical protein
MKKVSKKAPNIKKIEDVEYISLNGDMQKKIKGGAATRESDTDRACSRTGCGSAAILAD